MPAVRADHGHQGPQTEDRSCGQGSYGDCGGSDVMWWRKRSG